MWRTLRTAAASGDIETCQALIDIGISTDLPTSADEITPLAAAVIAYLRGGIGRQTIDLLVQAGANPHMALDNKEFGKLFSSKLPTSKAQSSIFAYLRGSQKTSQVAYSSFKGRCVEGMHAETKFAIPLPFSLPHFPRSVDLITRRGSLIQRTHAKVFDLMDELMKEKYPAVDFLRNRVRKLALIASPQL